MAKQISGYNGKTVASVECGQDDLGYDFVKIMFDDGSRLIIKAYNKKLMDKPAR
jgi:hypothetical protein